MTGKLHWAKETWKNKVLEPRRDLQHELPTLNSENWFALPATPMIQAPSILQHFAFLQSVDWPPPLQLLVWTQDAYELPKDEAAQIREPWRRAAEWTMKSWGDHHQGVLGSWTGWTELKWWTKSSARNKLMNLIWIWLVVSNMICFPSYMG